MHQHLSRPCSSWLRDPSNILTALTTKISMAILSSLNNLQYNTYFSRCWVFWDRAQNMLIWGRRCSTPLNLKTNEYQLLERMLNHFLTYLFGNWCPHSHQHTSRCTQTGYPHMWLHSDTYWDYNYQHLQNKSSSLLQTFKKILHQWCKIFTPQVV